MFGELKKQHLILAAVMLMVLFGAGVRYGRYLAVQKITLPTGFSAEVDVAATSQPDQTAAVDPPKKTAEVTVYVAGAVTAPGVFTLKEGSRVVDALDLAKASAEADLNLLNLAKKLNDGEKILVPVRRKAGDAGPVITAGAEAAAGEADRLTMAGSDGGSLININQAEAADLEKLPGIGPSKAQAVIKYRQENGAFACLEDVDKVPGIGPATLENLKDMITF